MPIKKSILFIINPFSGTSEKKNIVEFIDSHLDQSRYVPEYKFSEYAGHAIVLANQGVKNKTDIIVAVGGDGSVNEIAKEMVHTDSVLGIIPGGSGNGLAKHLGINRKVLDAINVLNTGKVVTIDSCKANNDFFLNVAGIGIDAKVAFMTKENKTRGLKNYVKASVIEAFKYKPSSLEVVMDNVKVNGEYSAAIVANASYYGYNFSIAPLASLQDGLLDVILVRKIPIHGFLPLIFRSLNRTLHKSKYVKSYTAQKVTFNIINKEYLHLDGEGMTSDKPIIFSIIPNSIKVIVPSDSKSTWKL